MVLEKLCYISIESFFFLKESQWQMELKKKENEIKALNTDILRLEETVKEQADMIEELKGHLQVKAPLAESALLSTSHRISEQETRVLRFTIAQLRDELSEARQDAASTRAILETQKAVCLNQAKEIAKRRQQLDESLEMVEQMREELKEAKRKANGIDWEAKERMFRMQIEGERVENAKKMATLEAKLKMMRQREDSMLEESEELRTALEECQKRHEDHMKECARCVEELCAKDAEVSSHSSNFQLFSRGGKKCLQSAVAVRLVSLRARLEVSTSLRAEQRAESTEDLLVSQIKSLTAQINEMKNIRADSEHLSSLENRVGSLTATNEFLEKQLKEAKEREDRLKEELDKWRGEVDELKAELEKSEKRLLECEGSAELTNRYLVGENSKIKQQKAEIRQEKIMFYVDGRNECELIALKREHAKLLEAKQKMPDEAELATLREEVASLKEKLRVAESAEKEGKSVKVEPMEAAEFASLLEELATLKKKIHEAEQREMEMKAAEMTKENRYTFHKGDSVSIQTPQKEGVFVKQEECEQCKRLKEEMVALKQSHNVESASATNEKNERMKKELTEKCALQKAISEKLQKELLETREKNDELRSAMRVLDEQCDKLMELKKRAEAGRKKALERLTSVTEKMNEMRREKDQHQQADADYKRVLQERERLSKKVEYLTEELRETHTDYREELAKLARQMSETKQKDASENESFAFKIEALETEKRQMETTMRSLERQIEQSKSECELRANEVSGLRESQRAVIDENAKLRDGLAFAIAKAEKFKEELETLKEANSMLSRDLAKAKDDKGNAVVRADTLQQAVSEKERLIAYLQSQLHMRSATKIKRSSSRSTLISVASESSVVDVEISDHDEQDRRIIYDSDVLENRTPRAVRTTSISITRKSDAYVNAARTPEPLTAITNRSESSADGSVLPPTTPRIGTMKHDIPHRWKTFLVLKQARCLACYEGLPRVRHAMKCTGKSLRLFNCWHTSSHVPSFLQEKYIFLLSSSGFQG
ncbi:unnamed protein product [Toxocara canis]|uniref:Uncharacterized protein n=1 Tax=Toxocara canis TaxID=6265 RepID=A0A183TVQ4_TOXCA|nr:unnamed protein product [Toxocara canis]